jgi:hypothetical protein
MSNTICGQNDNTYEDLFTMLKQRALVKKKLSFLTFDNGTRSRFLCVPFRKAKGDKYCAP